MIRDFDKVTGQLEAVCFELEQAAEKNQIISVTNACKAAKVSHSWICQIIDASSTYKIPDYLVDRYEYARCLIFDVITQEVSDVGRDRLVWDDKEEVWKYDDSPLKVARSKLKLDASKWLYSRLMPRLLGDKVEVTNNNSNQTNILIVEQVKALDMNALKQIANTRLIEQSNNND